MASIGPLALGAKGCVERLRPTEETTHYILCVAPLLHPLLSLTHWIFRSLMLPYKSSSHSAKCVRCASLCSGGRRLAVRKTIEYQIGALPRTPFPAAREFPSRGNEKDGEEKQRVIYFMYHSAVFPPFLVVNSVSQSPECVSCHMTYKANPVTLTLYSSPVRAIPQPSGPKAPSNLRTFFPAP